MKRQKDRKVDAQVAIRWINPGRDEMVWTRFIRTGIYEPREARTVHCYSIQGGSKSKLLILSEYVHKTEKIGGV